MVTRDPGFELFFVDLYPKARHVGTRILGERAAGEDVAAEALARAYLRWRTLARQPYREAWVLRVATNLALDAVRRRPRWLRAVPPPAVEDEATDRTQMAAELRRLPRRQREVVTLRYLLDMSEKDVAGALGIAPGTVKATASHALSAMRTSLLPNPVAVGEG